MGRPKKATEARRKNCLKARTKKGQTTAAHGSSAQPLQDVLPELDQSPSDPKTLFPVPSNAKAQFMGNGESPEAATVSSHKLVSAAATVLQHIELPYHQLPCDPGSSREYVLTNNIGSCSGCLDSYCLPVQQYGNLQPLIVCSQSPVYASQVSSAGDMLEPCHSVIFICSTDK